MLIFTHQKVRAKLEELKRLKEQRQNEKRVRHTAQRFKEARLQCQNKGIQVSFLYRRPDQSNQRIPTNAEGKSSSN